MLKRRYLLAALYAFAALVCVAPQASAEQPDVKAHFEEGFVEPKNRRQQQWGGWYLGVYGSYTSTGLYLTEVYRGTAAARAGLEVGDRIISVNGRQISLLYPLNLALQSTINGRVILLVQDRRTQRLINLPVRLTRSRIHT
ncbi:PDZ domain-containing protein [Stieleria sp. TO1_6]|uniref:PDZ domain-containing protein n=1 Tax=Stieleria tagensis TaxID=2956795 RepID=UPI00209AD796|nr:PDZ domain-containing protein [Stieleria tagensis]MCO8125036.1 PDZ domain-containing protein [Stieleria tagensis]